MFFGPKLPSAGSFAGLPRKSCTELLDVRMLVQDVRPVLPSSGQHSGQLQHQNNHRAVLAASPGELRSLLRKEYGLFQSCVCFGQFCVCPGSRCLRGPRSHGQFPVQSWIWSTCVFLANSPCSTNTHGLANTVTHSDCHSHAFPYSHLDAYSHACADPDPAKQCESCGHHAAGEPVLR